MTLVGSLLAQSDDEYQVQNYPAREQTIREALAELDRLVDIHGPQEQITVMRAEALSDLAWSFHHQARYREATIQAQGCVDLLTKLVADHKDVEQYRLSLLKAQLDLAQLLSIQGADAKAEQLLRAVFRDLEPLTGPPAERHRGVATFELAKVFARAGRSDEAEVWAGRSVEAFTRRRETNPDGEDRDYLCQSHWHRATARNQLKRYAAAAEDWGEAAKLARKPMDTAFYLAHRGSSLVRAGDAKSATAEFVTAIATAVARLNDPKQLTGLDYYDAAAVYSLAIGGTEDPALKEKYGAEAVRLLGEAAKVGFLRDPAKVRELQSIDEYTALHGRADYKELIKTLTKKP